MLQVNKPEYIADAEYLRIVDTMPILCVDLVLRDSRGGYLLVKRNNEPLKDQWWVPGGRVYKGERLEEAAHRKMREELSIEIASLSLIGYHEYLLVSGHHSVSFVFTGTIPDSTNIMLDGQSSEWGLFPALPDEFDIQPLVESKNAGRSVTT